MIEKVPTIKIAAVTGTEPKGEDGGGVGAGGSTEPTQRVRPRAYGADKV